MSRNIRTEAIVLKTGRVGEIHKAVTLLTPERGIVEAIAHGVYKGRSKLGGVSDPYCWSTSYLYYEPVKQSYKITDMECRNPFESVRRDLERFYAASLWAEVIIRSHAGGEGAERIFELLKEGLHSLDSPADPPGVQIQFLWRFIRIAGFLPDIDTCAVCGRALAEREAALYRRSEGEFACAECMREWVQAEAGGVLSLSAGARRYLAHTAGLSFAEALKVDLERAAKERLLRLIYRFMEDILEMPLKTLQAGVL